MKKPIITAIIVLVIATTGFLIYRYVSSFHDVKFTIKQPGVTVDIYQKNNKLSSISGSAVISLQNGDYSFVPRGEKVADKAYNFSIPQSKEVIVDPDYSEAYLKKQLASEREAIHSVIKAAFPAVINDFNISDGQLFKKGEWYGTVLSPANADPRDNTDLYRIILQKSKNGWKIIHQPEIVVTKSQYKNVPLDILTATNNLTAA